MYLKLYLKSWIRSAVCIPGCQDHKGMARKRARWLASRVGESSCRVLLAQTSQFWPIVSCWAHDERRFTRTTTLKAPLKYPRAPCGLCSWQSPHLCSFTFPHHDKTIWSSYDSPDSQIPNDGCVERWTNTRQCITVIGQYYADGRFCPLLTVVMTEFRKRNIKLNQKFKWIACAPQILPNHFIRGMTTAEDCFFCDGSFQTSPVKLR